MKRKLLRAGGALLGILVLCAVALAATAHARWDRTFAIPEPAIRASLDPEAIDRGRYLVFGPGHCSYCHTPPDQWARLDAGEEIPLVGGFELHLPLGVLRTPNLTPDAETGIGRLTDGQIARMLRHNVKASGQASIPLMEFQDMSDDDVAAIIAYLRSVPGVRNPVPPSSYNMLGKGVMAMLVKPTMPNGTPPVQSPAEAATVERGAYVASAVANCAGCHSPRNMADGSYTGPRFSGGVMEVDGDPDQIFGVPNLTPHPRTGHIVNWSEDMFVARFRAGPQYEGSHMPWAAFARMSDTDLRAVYRFLMSLEPVENETGPILQPRKKG